MIDAARKWAEAVTDDLRLFQLLSPHARDIQVAEIIAAHYPSAPVVEATDEDRFGPFREPPAVDIEINDVAGNPLGIAPAPVLARVNARGLVIHISSLVANMRDEAITFSDYSVWVGDNRIDHRLASPARLEPGDSYTLEITIPVALSPGVSHNGDR